MPDDEDDTAARETYARLLQLVHDAGVLVRTASRGDFAGEPAEFPGAYDRIDGSGQIWLRVQPGDPVWLDNVGATAFAAGAPDPIAECIIAAHEFGHHRSAVSTGDADKHHLGTLAQIRWRIGTENPPCGWHRKPPTTADGNAMMGEEIAAWDFARAELEAIGFAWWERFDHQRGRALQGYVVGIAAKVPGWTSPTLGR